MHDRVDVAVADDLGDEWVTDVGADELRAAHPATGEIFATLKLTTDFHH